MEQLAQKNIQALRYVMRNYTEPVQSLVRRVGAGKLSEEDIEECVSDVFVKVWHQVQDYDSTRGSPRTWIFILAKYTALDYRRRKIPTAVDAELSDVADPGTALEQQVLTKAQIHDLVKILQGMDRVDREVFYRRYFYYQSVMEIAQELACSRQAVDNRLWRVRKALRQRMIAAWEEEG